MELIQMFRIDKKNKKQAKTLLYSTHRLRDVFDYTLFGWLS